MFNITDFLFKDGARVGMTLNVNGKPIQTYNNVGTFAPVPFFMPPLRESDIKPGEPVRTLNQETEGTPRYKAFDLFVGPQGNGRGGVPIHAFGPIKMVVSFLPVSPTNAYVVETDPSNVVNYRLVFLTDEGITCSMDHVKPYPPNDLRTLVGQRLAYDYNTPIAVIGDLDAMTGVSRHAHIQCHREDVNATHTQLVPFNVLRNPVTGGNLWPGLGTNYNVLVYRLSPLGSPGSFAEKTGVNPFNYFIDGKLVGQ